MASILDMAPYPWHDPLAVELHAILYRAIPRPSRAIVVAGSVGIDTGLINADQAPYDVWRELLELSATSGKTRALAGKLRVDPNAAFAHPLLEALLNNRAPVTDHDPADSSGAPLFLKNDDSVSEPEAYLFHDDLTMSIGRISWLIGVLKRLEALAPAVCRLEVTRNDKSQSGTGVRIGVSLLLTNWHVLFVGDSAATAVTAEFGYEADNDGNPMPATAIICDPDSIRGDESDDWAIIRPKQPFPVAIPIVDVFVGSAPVKDAPAFIIQHPGGGRKRVAYVRNQITYFDDRVVQYLTDTQVGSSGSPVFDDLGRLVALHHAGGRPQLVAGQLPVKKNEGIRISRVTQGLKAAGIA